MTTTEPLFFPPKSPLDGGALLALGQAELGHRLRTKRLVTLATDLAAQPTASLPKACGSAKKIKGAYRFFDLADADPDDPDTPDPDAPAAIRAAFFHATKRRLDGLPRVLAVQDTTDLELVLGPHLHVHSTLAVSTHGVPLGLLSQLAWTRDPHDEGARHQRKTKALDQKESLKWLLAWEESQSHLPLGTQLIHVGDREADIYDLFLHAVQSPPHQLLVRACHDRKVDDEVGHLRGELEALPVQDACEVQLPRAGNRKPRRAVLSLRYKRVTLRPPKHRTPEKLPKSVLDAILVQEYAPPAGEKAVAWLLLTTVAVESLADAWERVAWYGYRWRVERYHFILKSGCKIEARQLETVGRMNTCLAVYSVVASRLLELTYHARESPGAPGEAWLSREEWEVLWLHRHPEQPLPASPTVRDVVREIAGLGGFLGRKGDGEPGVKTLWEGWHDFQALLAGYRLAKQRLTSSRGNLGNA